MGLRVVDDGLRGLGVGAFVVEVLDGVRVEKFDGPSVVGTCVGPEVGTLLGTGVGIEVGTLLGVDVGPIVGSLLGVCVDANSSVGTPGVGMIVLGALVGP